MAQQLINIGTSVNDRSGDPLRLAFDKVNQNFTELYSVIPGAGDIRFEGSTIFNINGVSLTNSDETHGATASIILPANASTDSIQLNNNYGGVSIATGVEPGYTSAWSFNPIGQLILPSKFPVSFTAVLDTEHFHPQPGIGLDGPAWYFDVSFNIDDSGSVEVTIENNIVFFDNPGYANGHSFSFTEADHGIPNYLFTIQLVDITLTQAGYIRNLVVSMAPNNQGQFYSETPVILTVNSSKWAFGENAITFPDNSIQTTSGGVVISDTAPLFNKLWFNSLEGRLYVKYNTTWIDASPTELDQSAIRFNDLGQIELPVGGDIIDSNGVSVLSSGGLPLGGVALLQGNANEYDGWKLADGSSLPLATYPQLDGILPSYSIVNAFPTINPASTPMQFLPNDNFSKYTTPILQEIFLSQYGWGGYFQVGDWLNVCTFSFPQPVTIYSIGVANTGWGDRPSAWEICATDYGVNPVISSAIMSNSLPYYETPTESNFTWVESTSNISATTFYFRVQASSLSNQGITKVMFKIRHADQGVVYLPNILTTGQNLYSYIKVA